MGIVYNSFVGGLLIQGQVLLFAVIIFEMDKKLENLKMFLRSVEKRALFNIPAP